MDKIVYNGVDIYVRLVNTGSLKRKRDRDKIRCVVTGKKIEKDEDQHYLVLNNWKLFDNCWISKEAVDDIGFEECFRIAAEKGKRLKVIEHERKQLRMDFSLTND